MTIRTGFALICACAFLAGCGGGGLGLGQMFGGGGGGNAQVASSDGTVAKTADDVDLFTGVPDNAYVVIQDIEVKVSKTAMSGEDPSPLTVQAELAAKAALLGADAVIKVNISDIQSGKLGTKFLIGTGTAVRF